MATNGDFKHPQKGLKEVVESKEWILYWEIDQMLMQNNEEWVITNIMDSSLDKYPLKNTLFAIS